MIAKSEHKEQVEFFGQARALLRRSGKTRWRKLLYAVPNGGKRDIRTAGSLKLEGVTKGIPDISFDVPTKKYHGLRIEMKVRSGGRVSPEQKEIMGLLGEVGYSVEVCKGSDEALQVFACYLEAALNS